MEKSPDRLATVSIHCVLGEVVGEFFFSSRRRHTSWNCDWSSDVCSSDLCRALTEECIKRFGRIDVLHNNVGIAAGDGGPVHLSEEAWDRIHAVNLKGMFLTCKHVLPVMREQRAGVIINVSS